MMDGLSRTYAGLISGAYDCLDRIVLNAYFRFAQNPGGFRVWWRQLQGEQSKPDNASMLRMAGRFQRQLRCWAHANGVPVRRCRRGEHKHEIADHYLAKTAVQEGLFLILIGRAQAPVFEVLNSGHIQRKKPYPYLNHFSFHILDREWGHITIQISSHPPFPAQIILNGHEYIARQAQKLDFNLIKEGNCFTRIDDPDATNAVTEALASETAIRSLTAVCDRWIYKACLCFALNPDEQKQSRFRYEYSIFQLEYSRNLLFKRGSQMGKVVEALVDRNRSRFNVKRLTTILGRKNRPHHRKRKVKDWQVTVDRPSYDLSIFKVHCGAIALKIYTKGERVLRTEAMTSDARALRCGRDISQFAKAATALKQILERFLEALSCVDECFVSRDVLENLSRPSRVGTQRVGGINMTCARMRKVARALLGLSAQPFGFTCAQLAAHVQGQGSGSSNLYSLRQAAYDLQKFVGRKLVGFFG
jgi:hypothetical protein